MRRPVAFLIPVVFALSACLQTPEAQNQASGAAVGGVLGAITATVLGADTEWLILGTLAGAAAGAIVAQNQRTGECAYANGDGTYYRAACR